ncbi:MAG: FeoA family protein [Candidatus Omnitrophica bacterium]|nr:FeoA family protein [Candidatus Omnitrophota bacterium]
MKKTLIELKTGHEAKVIEILGGEHCQARLSSMGLVVDKNVKKLSSHFFKGPQTVEVGKTRLAIGYNMAKKIIVQE